MFPTFPVGPLTIQASGMIYILGFGLGLSANENWSSRFQVDGNKLSSLILTSAIIGLLGARLTYAASAPHFFLTNPLALISLNPLLFDLTGGVVIALSSALVLAYRRGVFDLKTLDAVTPLAAMMNISLGVAHLATGAAYGTATDLAWGIYLWNATRHPTQIYEIFFALLTFGAVWYAIHHPLQGKGQTFALFLLLSSTGHLINTAFLDAGRMTFAGVRGAQIIAYLVLAFSLWMFGKTLPKEG
jgi:prolipoprotein diacylglyceryltransferase